MKKWDSEHYGLNVIFEIKSQKVFQDLENGQKKCPKFQIRKYFWEFFLMISSPFL